MAHAPTKRRARPQLRAASLTPAPPRAKGERRRKSEATRLVGTPAEWASLLGELSPGDQPPQWRAHDRTDLELALDYPFDADGPKKQSYVWDAYFFLPKSLRISKRTYGKDEIYKDFQSYVRFAVAGPSLDELAEKPIERLEALLEKDGTVRSVRELKIFACKTRTSLMAARREVRKLLEEEAPELHDAARALCGGTLNLLARFRGALQKAHGDAALAAAWVDEDLSLVAETLLASFSLRLRGAGYDELAALVASGAVREARYRTEQGFDSVGAADVRKRDVEHLEFRRHLLKRFTSSVLHLRREISEGGKLTLQILYAVAASVAMSFAVVAAVYHGPQNDPVTGFSNLWTWAMIVVLAYAGKDRIKATLQGVFSKWVHKRLPDRRWKLRDPLTHTQVRKEAGRVLERSGFISIGDLPKDVKSARNSTRQHPLEEQARPEEILWHQKTCQLSVAGIRGRDERFVALTEVFRLDLNAWLLHTDDPKQRVVFADPEDRHIYTATAPRVYNISIVYRLRKADAPIAEAEWRRIRVVVSRKGIQRIDPVV